LLKIAKKLRAVLGVFRNVEEELRIEEIQRRLQERGMEVPKTTLRTWLNLLEELGLIRIDFEIERSRGARVVAKYSPRILMDRDLIVGIPVGEIEKLKEKRGDEVVEYLLRRSGYTEKEIEEKKERFPRDIEMKLLAKRIQEDLRLE